MRKTICYFLGACFFHQIGSAHAAQKSGGTIAHTPNEMPFELRGGFLIVIKGQITELQELKFILDTGASYSVVDRRVAQKLSLRRHAGRVFSFDKYIPIEWAEFPVAQFGPIEIHDVSLMVADLGNSWKFPGRADAIIGLDLLRRSGGFLVDYDARRVLFRFTSTSAIRVPPKQDLEYFTVKVLVQGQPVRLLVDTAMDGILLYEDRLRKRFPKVRLEDEKEGVRVGSLRVKQARLPGVLLSAAEWEPTVYLMKGPSDNLLSDVDGYLGISALNARQIEFNFEANTLAWK